MAVLVSPQIEKLPACEAVRAGLRRVKGRLKLNNAAQVNHHLLAIRRPSTSQFAESGPCMSFLS